MLISQLHGKLGKRANGILPQWAAGYSARRKCQGDACCVGSHEYLPYFPGVWSSKHLILAIGSNVQKSNESHLSVSACSLSGLEAVAGMGRSWL